MAEAMISFEENGFPVELISDRDIQKAVSSSRLRRDTIVKIYTPGQPVVTRRADTVERLKPFLGVEETPPPVGEPEASIPKKRSGASPKRPAPVPAAEPARPHAESFAAATAPGTTAVFLDEESYHSAQDPAYSPPPPPMEPQSKSFQPWILPSILVGILVLAALSSGGGSPGTSNSYSDVPSSPTYNDLGTDVYNTALPVDVETVGVALTFYAVRDAAVRAEPNSSSRQVATLTRGDSIFGIRVRLAGASEEWIRIESGEHAGAYIWQPNTSDESRPTLARSLSDQWSVATEVGLYSAPDETSRRLDTLSAGLTVHVVGELPNGWWEIARQSGGVAYVPPWGFAYEDGDWHSDETSNTTTGNSIAPAEPPQSAAPAQPARPPAATNDPPPEPRSWCVLKNGEEIRTTETECRDRGGEFQYR